MDILIATHGRPDFLEKSLRSLLSEAHQGYFGKVVVVENGSRDGAEFLCRDLGQEARIRYLWHSEPNKSAAMNYGLSHCDDGLVFMTDDDILVETELLATYARQEKRGERGRFFGGPTEASYESEPDPVVVPLLPSSAKGWSSTPEAMVDSGCFVGFNWAAYKVDLVEAGGFNPDFGPGSHTGATGQESEMQRRLRKRGAKGRYLPEARVVHRVPASRCSRDWLLRRSYRQGVERGLHLGQEDFAGAKRYLAKSEFRNGLTGAKALLTLDGAKLFENRFLAQRHRGFRRAMTLLEQQALSQPPYYDFGQAANPSPRQLQR